MSAIGDENGSFFIAFIVMIGSHNHYAGEFAVGACHRLHGETRHTRYFAKEHIHFIKDGERTLGKHTASAQLRQERVEMRKAGIGGDTLGDFGVVFHRAGAERVKIGIDAEIATR